MVAYIDESMLNTMFPGIPPNTQVRVVGPIQPIDIRVPVRDARNDIESPDEEESSMEDWTPPMRSVFRPGHVSAQTTRAEEKETIPVPTVSAFKKPATKSASCDWSEDEYVERISTLAQKALGSEYSTWTRAAGTNLTISHKGPVRIMGIKNVVFEVNGITVNGITVGYHLAIGPDGEVPSDRAWHVALSYIPTIKAYNIPHLANNLQHSDINLITALRKTYASLKALRCCDYCHSVWNTELSPNCPVCMFSNYFTRENEKIECPVCMTELRDFFTPECGHRLCYKCMFKLRQPRRCPSCRTEIEL